jgi:cell division protein FtsB
MKNKIAETSSQVGFPFAGLLFLFVVLFGLQCWNLKENIARHLNLRESRAQMKTILPQAQNIQDNLTQLGQDLLALAKTNAEAQKIVGEFKIQFNPEAK